MEKTHKKKHTGQKTAGKNIDDLRHQISRLEKSKIELENARNDFLIDEAKIRALVENSPDIICNVDREGVILYANRPLLGITPDQILGMNITEFADPAYHNALYHAATTVFKDRTAETHVISKTENDGSIIWLEVRFRSIIYEDNVIVAMLIIRDITERRMTESALQESEKKFRQITENMLDIITVADANGKIIYQSPSVHEITGYTPEEVIGKSLFSYFHPDDLELSRLAFMESLRGNPAKHAVIRFLHKNGNYIWLEGIGKPLYDESGRITGFLAASRDITEREKTEDALKNGEESLKMAQKMAHVGNWEWNIKTNIIKMSDELLNIYGLEITGTPIDSFSVLNSLVHPDDRDRLMEEMISNLTIRHGEGAITYRIIRPNGEVRWLYAMQHQVKEYDRDGLPVIFVGAVQDITERKQMEDKLREYSEHLVDIVEERTRELRDAKETAEKASNAKSLFLAKMSHEFRTPLNSVLGFSRLMKMGYDPDEYESNLDNIITSGEHLLAMINDVLDYTRIESGKMKFTFEPISIDDILIKCIRIIRPMAEKKNLKLEYAGPKETMVIGDIKWLQQIFINLLNNAVKFTDNGGSVKVEADEKKGTMFVKVIDTGIGISEEDRELIFQEFSQGKGKSFEDIIEGTGLGLSISKKLVEAHGGEIYLDSEPGKGSTFTILLPCAKSFRLKTPDDPRRMTMPQNITDRYILIVDDQRENREFLCRYFNKFGQKYLTAESGKQSIKIMMEHDSVALILMDIKMKEMSGTDAMKIIKINYNVPIIAVTAFAQHEDRERLLNEGFDDYIPKPIDINLLAEKINFWLRKQ